MNNQPIGVLDSGVGGLTIWKEIVKELPNESTIYIADSKNLPYGNKTSREIYRLSRRIIKFILQKKAKLIVIACNTITVSCLDKLRLEFPQIPIVGTVPVVKTASKSSKNKIIGILSTQNTSKSLYKKELIKKFAKNCKVINIGTNILVPLIEEGRIKEAETVLPSVLIPFIKAKIDVLALGCSHFPFLRKPMQKIMGSQVLILDSGAAIARQVKRILIPNHVLPEASKPPHTFFTTGNKDQFKMTFRRLMRYNTAISIETIDL